ncbi:MAG: cardiolipin synthase [Erysipelotrichaceae bacterium]|nr:cardiolipin synthase [Erysipelotrichaceae bacterium]
MKTAVSRILVILIAAAIQIFIQYSVVTWLRDKLTWIEAFLHLLAVIITLGIIKNSRHLSMDISWIILINVIPLVGTALYLFLGADLFISRTYRSIREMTQEAARYYTQDEEVMRQAEEVTPDKIGQFRYISSYAGYPVYKNTGFEYYDLGQAGFPVMIEELRKAKKFIFLEYFIIEEGYMWDSILAVLEQKVKEGVEVRVMYDDFGSFFLLPGTYYRDLEAKGIKCIPFNRISLVLNIILNHRDHRKIMVIDGKVAFSGGINLADEYINRITRFGKWKDNVIKVTGEAVWSYTVMFLTHWNALRKEDRTFLSYRCETDPGEDDGFIAPYGDTPLDNENCAQNIYTNIINEANAYCYICTPYLIIDTEMINALILCARRGVDIRIITPGIPDKKMVFAITRSYYEELIKGGVKIFQYDPGFVHAKVMVADDEVASVGTVNLDYRSLYLHFENGAYLYGSKKIETVKNDLISMMEEGHELTLAECENGPVSEFLLSVLRLFAPLM